VSWPKHSHPECFASRKCARSKPKEALVRGKKMKLDKVFFHEEGEQGMSPCGWLLLGQAVDKLPLALGSQGSILQLSHLLSVCPSESALKKMRRKRERRKKSLYDNHLNALL
jgi:hypothetical protein